MTRVAFVMNLADSTSWLGGANYLQNLLQSIAALPDRRIRTVLLVPPSAPAEFTGSFGADTVIRTSLVLPRAPLRMLGKVFERVFGRDTIMELFFRRHGLEVLSHRPPAGARSSIRNISWVPDLQHVALPGNFSDDEIRARENGLSEAAAGATIILLSSEHARRALAEKMPAIAGRLRVLRFASGLPAVDVRSRADLETTYGIERPFFHLPNQFWTHKNHRVVIRALKVLKDRGSPATVICTGHKSDYRHPSHYEGLMREVEASGVADRFVSLGIVPYEDVTAFLRHSLAVINPSYFEGWSTTVEEAKSTGKKILLSDIAVHREQAPERGLYFPPDDAEALADRMAQVVDTYSAGEEALAAQRAAASLPERLRVFASEYQAIALEAAGR